MSDNKDIIKNLEDGETEKVSGGAVSDKKDYMHDYPIAMEYGMRMPHVERPVAAKYGGPLPKSEPIIAMDYGMPEPKYIDPKLLLKKEFGEDDTEN